MFPMPKKSKRGAIQAVDPLVITCGILESIVASYPVRSRERKAIREAAEALIFLTQHQQLKASYLAFRRVTNRRLTAAQEEILRSIGIEP
jgi:hypothetical protein